MENKVSTSSVNEEYFKSNKRRVVITGIGVVAPEANNVEEFDNMLRNGKSGIKHIKELEESGFESQCGGVASTDLDLENELFELFEIDLASDAIKLACKAGYEAWTDAGLPIPDPDDKHVDFRSGVMIGCILNGFEVIGNKLVPMLQRKKPKRLGSMIIENTMASGPSAYLSSIFGLGNQAFSLNSACSTGLDSMGWGYHSVLSGWADRMVVGATDAFSTYNWAGFEGMRVLNNKCNHQPEKASNPMSANVQGFVPGSGAGVMILEEYEVAKARGAKIYGEILGSVSNSGGMRGSGSMTFPNKVGVMSCLKSCIQIAGINPNEIDYINGHLSGTTADAFEVANWAEALGYSKDNFPYINSTKSITGHCLGASGAVELVATLLQLNGGYIHPSLNTEELHPEIAKRIKRERIPLQAADAPDLKIAAKASFGFGDVNSALILRKWEE